MYFNGFIEGKPQHKNSVADLVEEFCDNQPGKNCKYWTKATKTLNSQEIDPMMTAEQYHCHNMLRFGSTVFLSRDYDVERDIFAPAGDLVMNTPVLKYPFRTPKASTSQKKNTKKKIDKKDEGLREPQVSDLDSESSSSEDSRKDSNASSGAEDKNESSDLDTIFEETGDEQESGNLKSDSQKNRDKGSNKKKRPTRALFSEEYDAYRFQKVNPMLDLEDPFREAMRKMQKGELTMAIIFLEAAVRRKPNYALGKHSTCWLFLGLCQAASEEDVLAIAAYRECLRLKYRNQDAFIALAVSYANENQRNPAINAIWNWLYNDPTFSENVNIPKPVYVSDMCEPLDLEIHQQVLELLIRVSIMCEEAKVDENIECAIGIMYCLVGDYDSAISHFHSGILICPRDERLWNRLGACLANSYRHEEAIIAYSNALKLVPGYVRARTNWAISCSKMGRNIEAIKHLLMVLNEQTKAVEGIVGKTSDYVWSSLKTLLGIMGYTNLDEAVEKRDLNVINGMFEDK